MALAFRRRKAVVRAILLDDEARSPSAASVSYGKLREPMVRFVHFVSTLGGKSKNGRNSVVARFPG